MHYLRLALTGLLLLVLASACGSAPGEAPAAAHQASRVITLVATEWSFQPSHIELEAGQPVTLELVNRGAIQHDVLLEEVHAEVLGAADEHRAGPHGVGEGVHLHAGPGQTARVSFVPEESGTYTFYCTLPGHKDAGMVGTVTIEGEHAH